MLKAVQQDGYAGTGNHHLFSAIIAVGWHKRSPMPGIVNIFLLLHCQCQQCDPICCSLSALPSWAKEWQQRCFSLMKITYNQLYVMNTGSSAIAEGPHSTLWQLKSSLLLHSCKKINLKTVCSRWMTSKVIGIAAVCLVTFC